MKNTVPELVTLASMTNQELLSSASPLIGDLGAAFYFIPETAATGKELGLKGMEFYVLGRGGTLGNCEGRVAAAAFGYFKPSMLAGIWDEARAKVDPRAAGRAHLACCANLGRAKLQGAPGLHAFVAAAEKVNDAADPDGMGLYSAISSEPLPDDAEGRAMQLIALLREYRGSAHLAALRAAGIDTKTAHHAKRPDMAALFGWTEDEAPIITDDVIARMKEAETMTDRIVEPAFAVLSDAERTALVEGLHAVRAALAA